MPRAHLSALPRLPPLGLDGPLLPLLAAGPFPPPAPIPCSPSGPPPPIQLLLLFNSRTSTRLLFKEFIPISLSKFSV